ncbi:MAG: SpoIIE family protein phosphatase [Bacillota bacterium]|nr:SpoIIE family protein phosphatase [Bacillota bacterium]
MLKTKDFKDDHFEIFENMADLIRVKDMNNNIIYTNDQILTNNKFNMSTKDSKRIVDLDDLKNSLQTEETIEGRDYSIKASPVYNDHGEVIASIEVFRDVTRERELETALKRASKEIEKDLLFAKKIQRKILPRKGKFENISIDFKYKPSKYLSGDIFDIFEIDDHTIGVYIVDVAGHGIAASMLTVFIRQTMYSVALESKSPSEVLLKLQEKFQALELEPERYFTMFYGVYNLREKELKYANAGHNSIPFLFNKDSITMLVNHGLPILGFNTDNTYTDKSVRLESRDSILMYTDGLIEAKNEYGEEFGEDRVKRAILNTQGNLLEELEDNHANFIGIEQKDDIAMILMSVK